MKKRTSFIIHNDSLDVLDALTLEQAGELFVAISAYQKTGAEPTNPIIKIAFVPFKNQFDRDNEKYQKVCERNEKNGKNGGRPKNPVGYSETQKTQSVILEPKKPDNDSKSDNDNEDTNVSITPLPPKGNAPSSFLMTDGSFLSFDCLFERIWKLYPNIRSKGDKRKAKDEFHKKLAKGESHEKIERGVAEYKRYCESTGEKQPDMFRWIRDYGWERDYPETVSTNQNYKQPPGNAGSSYSDTLRNSVEKAKEIVRMGENRFGDGEIRENGNPGNEHGITFLP